MIVLERKKKLSLGGVLYRWKKEIIYTIEEGEKDKQDFPQFLVPGEREYAGLREKRKEGGGFSILENFFSQARGRRREKKKE